MKTQPKRQACAAFALALLALAAGFSTAAASQPILSGETWSGSISIAGASESWTFASTAGDRIVVAAVRESGTFDTDIFLYAPGGGLEASTHGFSGGDRLERALASSGTYTITIQDWSLTRTGSYRVTLMKLPGSLNSSGDPDGGAIASGQTLAGQANSASDLDGFTFAGTSGDRILVQAVTLNGSLDTDLYLYPPGGGAAVASTHGFSGGDRLEYRLATSGTFTILIADWSLANTGFYAITFLSTTAAAAPIASNQTLAGTIGIRSDLEAYQFPGTGGERIIIAGVKTNGALDTDLFLYRPNGGVAIATTHGFSGGDRLECRLDSTGTYTLVVADFSLTNTGDFALTLLQIPGATSYPGDSDGGPIASGESVAGQMQLASDLDAFQFYGEAGARVLFTGVRDGGTLDTDLYLYPPGGGANVATTHGFSGGDLLEFRLTSTGVHTLVLEDYTLAQTGTYHATLLLLPGCVSSESDRDGGLIKLEGLGFPAFPASPQAGIDVGGDLDGFQFYGTPGDRVRVQAIRTSGALDTDLFLFPPGGGPAEANTHGFSGGDVLEKQLASEGLYTIVVRDWSLQQTGDYTIRLFDLSGGGLAPGLYGPQPPMGGRVYSQGGSHFEWDPVQGATHYDLYYGTDVTTPLQLLTSTTQPRAAMPVLAPANAVWYWSVIATTPTATLAGSVWWFRSSSDPTDAVDPPPATPRVVLFQNEPNPFNPSTCIRFRLDRPDDVSLRIFDPAGRAVRTLLRGPLGAGEHAVVWDGRDARGRRSASGIYFYRLCTGGGCETARPMAMTK
jgi:hypothetical protein